MRILRVLGAVACLMFMAGSAQAENLKVEARLIWGSDNDTNVDRKVDDSKLTEDLARIFKWKNYYQITNLTASISADATQTLEMSSKCRLTIKNMGSSKIEVSCFGDGKFVSKGMYSLSEGKWLTLAGSDKNDSAWFVVMRSRKVDDKD